MNESKPSSAIYPISANPPTNGHYNILRRCAACFEEIYWIAGKNSKKKLYFSDEARLEMMRHYVAYYKLPNVKVDSCDGAIVRYAEKKKIRFLIRGLRNSTDFQKEFVMAAANRGINDNIETICIFAEPLYSTMNSGIVAELASLGESIERYVIPPVAKIVNQTLRHG